jgi:putative SOS response-associated peptidase YedK
MCGRYVTSKATGDLLRHFEATDVEGIPPSLNVAPTLDVPIIAERLDEDAVERRFLIARWGLAPSWAKDIKIGWKLMNARSESILDKPAFRKAPIKRRALIPAEGHYEWEKPRKARRSRSTSIPRRTNCWPSGLYEFWPDPSLLVDDPHRWLLAAPC